ncbi:hypothetical protein N7470_004779 [Penicillium chermesinum]|nr:hypothetical protein N7470_004779 [Penicillium chermesinum]
MVGKKCITAAIHPIDKIHFCQFFHLGMATLMESIGASIENAQISESDKSLSPFSVGTTSWHGATANSADFMNRMAERSALSFTWSNQAGDCPIHWAVRYQNLETALWLYDHGAIPRFSIPMEETETIWHQALHETGEKSPMIFEMLMPSCNNQMDQVDRYAVASLFHQIMLTTMDCVMCAAVTTIDNLEFEMLREQLKAEGIQKCKLIWEDFVDVDLSPKERTLPRNSTTKRYRLCDI